MACLGSVTAPDFAERFIGTAVSEYKGLEIIVNNAGYTWDNVIQKMTDEPWYAMIDCHLTAPFRILRAAQPVIRAFSKTEAEAGQRVVRKVVNISSIAGLFGNAGQANYSTAKAGIVGMTQTLAKEWGRMNVTVNCVLGRGGTPEEAAGAVYLLCIPESGYVSGQTLMCSGGLTAI